MEAAVGRRHPCLASEQQAAQAPRSQEIGGGESETEGDGAHAIAAHLRVKKRDELGLRQGGPLVNEQKEAVMKLVEGQRAQGRPVGEILTTLGIVRSTYYRWKQNHGMNRSRHGTAYLVTPEEKRMIEEVKAAHPDLRHRQLQGVLQAQRDKVIKLYHEAG